MSQRWQTPFNTVRSTEPSFDSTADSSAAAYALESTATGRVWQGPSNRSLRISSKAADDFRIALGPSTVVAVSTGNVLILGGTVEVIHVHAGDTHLAVVSSTTVEANFTLGYGG